MRTLHVDSGREMRGGQWQALYLVERLTDAVLLARAGSPLFEEAARRKLDCASALVSRAGNGCQGGRSGARPRRARAYFGGDCGGGPAGGFAAGGVPGEARVLFVVEVRAARRCTWRFRNMWLQRLMDAGIRGAKIRVVHDGVPIPEPARPQPGRVVALASKPVEIPGISVDLTSDLWQDLSTASVFVYKSDMEGLGSGALAAMAAGVPVVASAVGGLPEVVESGKTGFLVTDDDFATPVRRLLDDPGSPRKWAAPGGSGCNANFQWKEWWRKPCVLTVRY